MLVEPMDKNRGGYPGKQISGKLLKVLHLWVEQRHQVQAGRQQMLAPEDRRPVVRLFLQ
jgi:hypothetical protein